MRNIANKSDNVSQLSAAEFNSTQTDLENGVTHSGVVLDPAGGADTDLNMLAQSMTRTALTAQSYSDGGSANAYVLSRLGTLVQPTEYLNGMNVTFVAGNANTGNSTINVSSLGVKKILSGSGSELSSGDISSNSRVSATYDSSADSGAGAFLLDPWSFGFIERFGGALLQSATRGSTTTHPNSPSSLDDYIQGGQWAYPANTADAPTTTAGNVQNLFDDNSFRQIQVAIETTRIPPRAFIRNTSSSGATWSNWIEIITSELTATTNRSGILQTSTTGQANEGTDITTAVTPLALNSTRIGTTRSTRTTTGTWAISGLKIGVPLIILADYTNDSVNGSASFTAAGSLGGVGTASRSWSFDCNSAPQSSTMPSCVLIPTGTTITLTISSITSGMTLSAVQQGEI